MCRSSSCGEQDHDLRRAGPWGRVRDREPPPHCSGSTSAAPGLAAAAAPRACLRRAAANGYVTAGIGAQFLVVALMGASIAEEQVALLQAHCPNLRFATVMPDGDQPGRERAGKVTARLGQNRWTRIVHLAREFQPDTVDAAEIEQLLGRHRQK